MTSVESITTILYLLNTLTWTWLFVKAVNSGKTKYAFSYTWGHALFTFFILVVCAEFDKSFLAPLGLVLAGTYSVFLYWILTTCGLVFIRSRKGKIFNLGALLFENSIPIIPLLGLSIGGFISGELS